jgi:hypothetical protein
VTRGATLLLGEGDLADEVRGALQAQGAEVLRLVRPTQREIVDAVERARPARAVVVTEDDALALRLALMVRDADEEMDLLITYFDEATAGLLAERIPNVGVTSLAEIVAPVLAAACVGGDHGALRRGDDGRVVGLRTDGGRVEEHPLDIGGRSRVRAVAAGLLRPHDRSAALLLYGALGLVAVLALETVTAAIVLDQSLVDAFYGAAKTLVTVDPNDPVDDGPGWYKTVVAALMLVALVFEAFFTAGIVNRLIDRRLTGLLGRNAVPRERHVIVVGLGRVGLRLCTFLRDCGVPVVAVDHREDDEHVGKARRAGLPVVIGRGGDPAVLARLSLDKARAVAAVADDDLQNLEIGLAALSECPEVELVLRVGDGAIANETRSLFRLGRVHDVHRIAAALIAAKAAGSDAEGVVCHDDDTYLVHPDGRAEQAALPAASA